MVPHEAKEIVADRFIVRQVLQQLFGFPPVTNSELRDRTLVKFAVESQHFEIRRAGKPVDPLGLLPRR